MANLMTYTRVCEDCGTVMHNVGRVRKLCDACRKKHARQRAKRYWHKNFCSTTPKAAPSPKTVEERDAEFRAENQRFIESAGSYGKGRLKEWLAAQNKKPAGVGAPTSCGDDGLSSPIVSDDTTKSEVLQ